MPVENESVVSLRAARENSVKPNENKKEIKETNKNETQRNNKKEHEEAVVSSNAFAVAHLTFHAV